MESKRQLFTPHSLGDAITSVIQVLEGNIKDLKINHENTVKQLRVEQERRFSSFSRDQEETIRKISKNIADTELETKRIKEEADQNVKSLKASMLEIGFEKSSISDNPSTELAERNTELKEITNIHDEYIKDMTSNLDKISMKNRDAVSHLLDNLEIAKQENHFILDKHNKAIEQLRKAHEAAFDHFKLELEKVKDLNEIIQSDSKDREDVRLENSNQISSKLEMQDLAIKGLEERLADLSENTVVLHNKLSKTHSKSMGELRDEFFSQMIVNKEVSNTLQEEFNEKLEEMNKILNNETTSNQSKIQDLREALDDMSVDMKQILGKLLLKLLPYLK